MSMILNSSRILYPGSLLRHRFQARHATLFVGRNVTLRANKLLRRRLVPLVQKVFLIPDSSRNGLFAKKMQLNERESTQSQCIRSIVEAASVLVVLRSYNFGSVNLFP